MDSLVENPPLPFQEEILNTPEKAETALRDFFRPLNTAVLRDLRGESGKEFLGIIAATTSDAKKAGLSELAGNLGISVQPLLHEIRPEEEFKNSLARDEVGSWDYSNGMTWFKSFTSFNENLPVLAMDTVVIANGQVKEKPSDENEIISSLLKMQGRRVDVRSGIGLQIPREGRGPLFFYEEIDIILPIKRLSEAEIREYLRQNPNAVNVAGGLDFSTDAGKNLISNGKITLQIPNGSLFNDGPDPKKLTFTKDALPALDAYFKGIPVEAIHCMLQNLSVRKGKGVRNKE